MKEDTADTCIRNIGRITCQLAGIELFLDDLITTSCVINKDYRNSFKIFLSRVSLKKKIKLYGDMFPENKGIRRQLEDALDIRNRYAHSVSWIGGTQKTKHCIANIRKIYRAVESQEEFEVDADQTKEDCLKIWKTLSELHDAHFKK
jgi:hypothetical protein